MSDEQGHANNGGRPPGSKNKRPPIKVAEVALEINLQGFPAVRKKYGRSFTPKLACRVVEHMKKVGGEETVIPDDLQQFADTKRPGRAINGPMTAPKHGDHRPYTVSSQTRIGLSVETVNGEPGGQVWSSFVNEDLIVISRGEPGKDIFLTQKNGAVIITKEPLA